MSRRAPSRRGGRVSDITPVPSLSLPMLRAAPRRARDLADADLQPDERDALTRAVAAELARCAARGLRMAAAAGVPVASRTAGGAVGVTRIRIPNAAASGSILAGALLRAVGRGGEGP